MKPIVYKPGVGDRTVVAQVGKGTAFLILDDNDHNVRVSPIIQSASVSPTLTVFLKGRGESVHEELERAIRVCAKIDALLARDAARRDGGLSL